MKLKRLVSTGLAAVMALSMVACGGSDSGSQNTASGEGEKVVAENTANTDAANTEKTDETLVVALASEPSSLAPTLVGQSENESSIISGAMLDTLVAQDQTTGEIIPNLATAWEWVDDYRLQFTLRDDVKMTDGSTMTPEDVVYTFETLASQSGNNDGGKFLDPSKNEVVDEHTVILGFNTIAPDIITMLTWTPFGIFSEEEVEACGGYEAASKNPVIGSGKYKFKEWVQGQYVLLERNEDYWNPDYAGYFKEIKFTFTQDAASREMAVEAGDATVAYDISVAQASTYVSNENVKTSFYSFGQVMHLWMNIRDSKPMQDVRVREAIDKAFDYDAIAAYQTGGQGTQSLGYIDADVPFAVDYYTTEERAQDIEGAKALLEEAGYGDGLTITALGAQDTEGLYTVMQAQLAQVGITLEINTVDIPTFVQGANGGDYDVIIVGEYLDSRNPSAWVFFDQESIDTFNIGGDKYTTPEIEAAVEAVIQAKDNDEAKEKVAELEELFKKDTLVLNLCPEMKAVITQTDIKGLTTRERGFLDVTNFYRE
ncbi:ABC transporter substrate-binding protein [Pseudobutyrivibrio sp.]|uniref:ABC transporter substrate-binding protein n=1 Tax=Pseudobutyrivibrio sp. TaxID=2014367 RepID=UPI001D2B9C60|nr:ABC transporter substrate-binding protein [Pseudobutyrivibrio sp.]MBE5911133.1 ABC transporter substrate-binding protein [Pseudobutyrivibrio sp.]